MLGIGGFTPLEGFMTQADWQGVCDRMTMASGLFWPIPITLSANAAIADATAVGDEIALVDAEDDCILATLRVSENTRSTRRTNVRAFSAPTTPRTRASRWSWRRARSTWPGR
jgi:ATP sulfurylase